MPRTTSSRLAPAPTPYRLNTPPGHLTSPVALLGRGHRVRFRTRRYLVPPSAPGCPTTPTDPESSPTIRPSGTLARTYATIHTIDHNPTSHSVATAASVATVTADSSSTGAGSPFGATGSDGPHDGEQAERESPSPRLGMTLWHFRCHVHYTNSISTLIDSDDLDKTPMADRTFRLEQAEQESSSPRLGMNSSFSMATFDMLIQTISDRLG